MKGSSVGFAKSSFCNAGNCVEVSHQADGVHVRNSRFPKREVIISYRRWSKHMRKALRTRRANLNALFPWWRYGNFAATFTETEIRAFEQGVLANESQLV
jgi:Domain of unknown function (DUF397)